MKKKKNKKSKSLSGLVPDKETIKKSGSTLAKIGSGTAGVSLGILGLTNIPDLPLPDSTPAWVGKTIPGVIVLGASIFTAIKVKNENLKAAAIGLGIAGLVDVVTKNFGDKLPSFIKLPKLNGLGYVQNYGGYDVNYFTTQQPVNGLGNAYSLGDSGAYNLGNLLVM